jgi:hypothetical protein
MKKLVPIVGVVIVLAGIGVYVWVDYSQAQSALDRARGSLRSLGESIDRALAYYKDANRGTGLPPGWGPKQNPEQLEWVQRLRLAKESYELSKIQVDGLRKFHATWLRDGDISAIEKDLEKYKEDLDKGLAKIPSDR